MREPAGVRFLKRLTVVAACLLLLPLSAPVATSSITDDAQRPVDTLTFEVRGVASTAEN